MEKKVRKVLKEYMIKGVVMDDERRFYQKIMDIYSQCSIDYDKA